MRFLVIDDHPVIRFGVAYLLRERWPTASIDEAPTIAAAMVALDAFLPNAIILDLSLPDATGLEGARQILERAGSVPVVILSANPEAAYAARLLRMGVLGFVPKGAAASDLIKALESAMEGRTYLTPSIADSLVGLLRGKSPDSLPHESLTEREMRIAQLIAAGKGPAEISGLLGISAKTVGTYRARIFEKTGWHSTAELTKYCLAHDLTDPV